MPPFNSKQNRHRNRVAAAASGQNLSIANLNSQNVLRLMLKRPSEFVALVIDLFFNPGWSTFIASSLLIVEAFICFFITQKVAYTEIDWIAYMQEVEGVVNGTYDYYELKGDTGPLVYPAGFVYIYTVLYAITNKGANIKLAQYIFIFFYMACIAIVFFGIYRRTRKVVPFALVVMCFTSHRVHSIFLLRLFNDPVAMIFLYAAIACLLTKQWRTGCLLYSLAVSIKMNVLLFAPALFIILVLSVGYIQTFKLIFLCGLNQLILGAPFLLANPVAYVHRSFELSRQFMFKWTVNWKFLPEELFLNRVFHLCLLAAHLIVLVAFLNKCLKPIGGLKVLFSPKTIKNVKLNADCVIFIMFISNFIGICFSRSLHYQFYVWYYHTLAYLLWSTDLAMLIKFLIFGVIELCWNVYPATQYSSIALHACHFTLLASLWKSLDDDATLHLAVPARPHNNNNNKEELKEE